MLGQLMRLPLRLVPPTAVVPVLSGANRGTKWTVGASNHGCWLGSYERRTQHVLATHIHPGMTVLDVGANVGYFTLLAARLVGPSGRVIAFEPFEQNTRQLRRHIALNGANAVIEPIALSDYTGVATLHVGNPSAASLFPKDAGLTPFQVRTVRLDDWRASGRLPRIDFVKMDIEGAEGAAIIGMERVIAEDRPTCFIALHGGPREDEMRAVFARNGYRATAIEDTVLFTHH